MWLHINYIDTKLIYIYQFHEFLEHKRTIYGLIYRHNFVILMFLIIKFLTHIFETHNFNTNVFNKDFWMYSKFEVRFGLKTRFVTIIFITKQNAHTWSTISRRPETKSFHTQFELIKPSLEHCIQWISSYNTAKIGTNCL